MAIDEKRLTEDERYARAATDTGDVVSWEADTDEGRCLRGLDPRAPYFYLVCENVRDENLVHIANMDPAHTLEYIAEIRRLWTTLRGIKERAAERTADEGYDGFRCRSCGELVERHPEDSEGDMTQYRIESRWTNGSRWKPVLAWPHSERFPFDPDTRQIVFTGVQRTEAFKAAAAVFKSNSGDVRVVKYFDPLIVWQRFDKGGG